MTLFIAFVFLDLGRLVRYECLNNVFAMSFVCWDSSLHIYQVIFKMSFGWTSWMLVMEVFSQHLEFTAHAC